MRKIYIAPETELIVTNGESLLNINSTVNTGGQSENPTEGTDPIGGGSGTGGDNGEDFGARQHNNWMWDTMEDEF